ncbi:hypothetical protein HMPREF0972_01959 [Actinomyces sp. oral taxon 848 str. F0332]|nr:hypothetical protein HMPREF0972_01959 [Actinomyces sp. oral taxon 848 str. F0332]
MKRVSPSSPEGRRLRPKGEALGAIARPSGQFHASEPNAPGPGSTGPGTRMDNKEARA